MRYGMRTVNKEDAVIVYSPSDLCRFMVSPFATWMERLNVENPQHGFAPDDADSMSGLLQHRGVEHEAKFLAAFRAQYQNVAEITGVDVAEKLQLTKIAMADGADVIYQACLALPPFRGFADFLVKVPGESTLGPYHYEVWDTKFSSKAKPHFAVQLCCYAEMVAAIQGRDAVDIVLALGKGEPCRLPVADFRFFYQHLKRQFLASEAKFDVSRMPDPAESKEWGRWGSVAEQCLLERDHVFQVANVTRNQIDALRKVGITTATALAETSLPVVPKISTGVFDRLKAQARIQKRSAGLAVPAFEIITPAPGDPKGLALLPPASPMDVFFDIEGFPLVEGGLEYLWGVTYFDGRGERQFKDFWAHDAVQEKQAFQAFIAWVFERWRQDPSMHIYHYANYEIAACRRLMQRYGVCENEVDALLRNQVFVDLYGIVRHGLRVGEPRYSIKNIEHIYRGKRDTAVGSGGDSVVVYDNWRQHPDGDSWQTSKILNDIRVYNIDDCNSTQELVDWLRKQQREHGIAYVGQPELIEPELSDVATARTQLRDQLLRRAEVERLDDPQRADITEMMAWLLEFHRRQDKPVWWRLFDRLAKFDDELVDDLDCIVRCQRTAREPFKPTPKARKLAYEYRFDTEQEFKSPRIEGQMWLLGPDDVKVTLKEFDAKTGLLAVQADPKPPKIITLIPHEIVPAKPIPEAIETVVRAYAANELGECAILDFLQRRAPRIRGFAGGSIIDENSAVPMLQQVVDQVLNMDNTYLCIQGPPGTGKTYTGKHVIAELVKRGKKIGIASNSHKAINNLLLGVAEHCREQGIEAHCRYTSDDDPLLVAAGAVAIKNSDLAASLQPGCVLGSTAWGFAREDMAGQLDYLFVDEAGQVAVANLVGMSPSAKNLVLKGDQMQLGQPVQGTHPGASGQSVLEYLLQDHATVPKELGVFLGTTFRMHPDVNHFISEAIYEGRLKTDDDNARQIIQVPADYEGPLSKQAGIVFVPVNHVGNAQASEEEAEEIARLAKQLLGRTYVDKKGISHILGWQHMLFVAPYNHQVNKLQHALGGQARIGSVDKFQGQEAPVVFLSLCASDLNEAPRGASFLLNKNRINVAISRAQCLAIVVANPRLASDFNGSLEDMRLVNLFARIVEEYGA